MSNPDFQILTQIYGFLGQFEREDIAAAARRRGISPHIRDALQALAKEARTAVKVSTKRQSHSPSRPTPPQASNGTIAARALRDISRFLHDERMFPDKATLAEFAIKMGEPDAANPKFSRDRVAHRLKMRAKKDESFRQRLNAVIEDLTGIDLQSRGWMDLILRK
jgi:hypothetical protein